DAGLTPADVDELLAGKGVSRILLALLLPAFLVLDEPAGRELHPRRCPALQPLDAIEDVVPTLRPDAALDGRLVGQAPLADTTVRTRAEPATHVLGGSLVDLLLATS